MEPPVLCASVGPTALPLSHRAGCNGRKGGQRGRRTSLPSVSCEKIATGRFRFVFVTRRVRFCLLHWRMLPQFKESSRDVVQNMANPKSRFLLTGLKDFFSPSTCFSALWHLFLSCDIVFCFFTVALNLYTNGPSISDIRFAKRGCPTRVYMCTQYCESWLFLCILFVGLHSVNGVCSVCYGDCTTCAGTSATCPWTVTVAANITAMAAGTLVTLDALLPPRYSVTRLLALVVVITV